MYSRDFTDWRSSTRIIESIKLKNGLKRDDDTRIFLQENANDMMNGDFNFYKKNMTCGDVECIHGIYPTRMYSSWFVRQRNNYDSSMQKNTNYKNVNDDKFKCQPLHDYRLN
jgi:hypothetical protein